MTTTLQKIQTIIAKEFALPENSISPEASLDSLGVDSLGSVEVLFRVEDEFQIRIPQDKAAGVKINTVQDIVDIVERLVAEQRQAEPRKA